MSSLKRGGATDQVYGLLVGARGIGGISRKEHGRIEGWIQARFIRVTVVVQQSVCSDFR